jgi:hypothetical protein
VTGNVAADALAEREKRKDFYTLTVVLLIGIALLIGLSAVFGGSFIFGNLLPILLGLIGFGFIIQVICMAYWLWRRPAAP